MEASTLSHFEAHRCGSPLVVGGCVARCRRQSLTETWLAGCTTQSEDMVVFRVAEELGCGATTQSVAHLAASIRERTGQRQRRMFIILDNAEDLRSKVCVGCDEANLQANLRVDTHRLALCTG